MLTIGCKLFIGYKLSSGRNISRRITVGACKAHNAKDFVVAARALNVTHTSRQTIDFTSTDGYN